VLSGFPRAFRPLGRSSLIRTEKGRTILLQWDETTPRPYSRLNLIQGTRGIFAGYPDRIAIEGRGETHEGQGLEAYRREFEHPLWKTVGAEAERAGGHGGMDFVMHWRIVDCLREGLPLDQDVYDAASWSAISPLSERSVANRSLPVDVPDFTRGRYKSREPLQVARASESGRFPVSVPARNQDRTNERKMPS